ncbi:hypothetical protein CBOM_00067 [Ceraceosorus bombacis]|uniref:Uncharacterized protein n=1 Tax=Ceraceosorus bombacis TaxID=401625 RepID=A0A0P1BAF7_9BASI|nr:hypothetical protein CBOM_00067 [Ceraceosorus bombacis]
MATTAIADKKTQTNLPNTGAKKFLKGMRSAKELRRQQQMMASSRSQSAARVEQVEELPCTASQMYIAFEEGMAAATGAGLLDTKNEVPPLDPISYSSTTAEGAEAISKAMSALHRLSFQYNLEHDDGAVAAQEPTLKSNAGPRNLKDLARLRSAVNALDSACIHANPGVKDELKPKMVRRKPVRWDDALSQAALASSSLVMPSSPDTPSQSAKPSSATFEDLANSDAFEAFESFSSLTDSLCSSTQSVDSLVTPPDSVDLAHQGLRSPAKARSGAGIRPPLRDFHSLPTLTHAHCRVLQVDAPLEQDGSSLDTDEDRVRAEMLNALMYSELPRDHELRRDSIIIPPIKSMVFKKGTNAISKDVAQDVKDDRDKHTKRRSTYARLTRRKVLNNGAPSPRIPSLLLSLSERSSMLAKVTEKSEGSPKSASLSASPMAAKLPLMPPVPPMPALPTSPSSPPLPKTPKTPRTRKLAAESVTWRPSDSSRASSIRRKMTQGMSAIPPLPQKSLSRPTTIDMGIPRKGLGPASIDVDTLERLIKDTEAIREEGDKEWRTQNVAGGEVVQGERPGHVRSSSEPAILHEIRAAEEVEASSVNIKTLSVQSEVLAGSRTAAKSSAGSISSVGTEVLLAPPRNSTEDQATPRANMTRSFSESQVEQIIEAPPRRPADQARASALETPMEELTTPTPTVAKSRMRTFQRSRRASPYSHSRQASTSSNASGISSHASENDGAASSVASSESGYDSLFESDTDYASDGEQSVGTSVAEESSDDSVASKGFKARSSKALSQYKPGSRPPKRTITPPLGQPAYQIVQQIRAEIQPSAPAPRPDGLTKLRAFHSETQVHRLGDQARNAAVEQLQDEVAQAMIDACQTFAKQDLDSDDEGSLSETEALRLAKGKDVILWHLKTHTRGDDHLFPNPHAEQVRHASPDEFLFPNPHADAAQIAPAEKLDSAPQAERATPKKSHMRSRHAPLDGSGTDGEVSDAASFVGSSSGRETPLLAPLRSNSISSVSSSIR